MKKVCGTCNFQINSRAGNNQAEMLCPFNNSWHKDNDQGCEKWEEYNYALSTKNRIDSVSQIKNKEIEEKRHKEMIDQLKTKEEDIIDLKPNMCGIGINLRAFLRLIKNKLRL